MSTAPQVRSLNCTNCGAALTIRAGGHTLSVVCVQCLSVLDARDPALGVLQTFAARQRETPLIPLATRGKLGGATWEVIGFQVREILVEGTPYQWSEYLLYNPFKGFRYLTEYDGHWNFVSTLRALPREMATGRKHAVLFQGETYRHFQGATAKTIFVMGEFPWQFRVGEAVFVADYIAPPKMISAERTAEEVVWTQGEYVPGSEVWKAFQLPGSPPRAKGVYANQPSPYGRSVSGVWGTFLLLLVLLAVIAFGFSIGMREEEVFRSEYSFSTASKGEASFVTPVFDLKGRPTNVEISIRTDLENDWAFFAVALINEQTGAGFDMGREVSYYRGVDSDGSWSEGSRNDSARIPAVPAGRYYLRVEPDMNRDDGALHAVRYQVRVRRDLPSNLYFLFAGLLLLIPPIFVSVRAAGFETARWQESSYASESGSDGEDE
ncbi:MAG: DUF4178 domain-containing protein [Acidobacteria bacterium]|nr:DUF4178 domain-containing protein [Acidobacteriota bacterium]